MNTLLSRLVALLLIGAACGLAGGEPEMLPPGHLVLHFESYPGRGVRVELERRGVRVLGEVPLNGLLVASDSAWPGAGLALRQARPIDPDAKVRSLASDFGGPYLVMFHGDVPGGRARELVEQAGLRALDHPGLLPGHLLVAGSPDGVRALADLDEVARIVVPSHEILKRRPVRGCPGPISESGPVADYSLEGAQWTPQGGSVALHYVFDNNSAKLSAATVSDQVSRAFQEWAQYANITIAASGQEGAARTIDILFATGAHGDAYPFTNTSSLAHTFYPPPANPEPVAGDIHFNDAESWDIATGVDLYSVALHEAGHALGLAHSADPNSVMYAYYHVASGLTADDIAAIQALYGPPASAQPTTTIQPTQPTQPIQPTQPTQPIQPTQPTQPAGGTGAAGPSLTITSPALTIVQVYGPAIAISGTASDGAGVASVAWSTSTGASGVAAGATSWSATVPLYIGNTTITVRAYDPAGNSSWRSLSVVRVQ